MRKPKSTEQQIAFALKQAETCTLSLRLHAKLVSLMSSSTIRRKKYGGVGITEIRRLRQLEDEKSRLKQIVYRPPKLLDIIVKSIKSLNLGNIVSVLI